MPALLRQTFSELAPVAFDASTFEIWGCLLNGARLVIFPSHSPPWRSWVRRCSDTRSPRCGSTAGLFHHMVEGPLESLNSVRQLLAGGDVLSVPHVQKVGRELEAVCQLINGYGPTENTTFTCCYAITAPAQLGSSVPIGRPVSNTQVYILDAHLQPVPIGVPGEVYIGGRGWRGVSESA